MSPSARKKGKKKIGFWVDETEERQLKEAAKALGMNMSDFLKTAFVKTTKTEGKDHAKEG